MRRMNNFYIVCLGSGGGGGGIDCQHEMLLYGKSCIMDKQQQKCYSPVYRETNIELNLHVLVMLP